MNRFDVFAALANFLKDHGPNSFTGGLVQPPTRKELKKLRPPRFKPAFSIGYRGFPKTQTRPGSVPAPTIDQVRRRERQLGQRIHVKNGRMYTPGIFFATDEITQTAAKAELQHEDML